jgi:threonylcarbamoyladenosine tRNA methylthiotransferase MtaB
VTEKSDTKARYYLRQARRENPDARIVLTGCFTKKMERLSGIDAFVPNLEKDKFLVKAGLLSEEEAFDLLGAAFHISQFEGRTRAFVKIQDGCDSFCSFCIIPFVRGRSQSRPLKVILQEVISLIQNGYKEIVLTGVHLGSYGFKKEDERSLAEVIEAVNQLPGLKRLRLSSIEPMGLSLELIERLSQCEKLSPHFHLPVQSGSNDILKRMRRQYDRENFLKHVEYIYRTFDHPSISTDIIVGFPGETETDFELTVDLARESGFSKTHIFPYSHRSGTLASRMEALPEEELQHRVQKLTGLCDELALEHKKSFLEKEVSVLVEDDNETGMLQGFTPNYLKVKFPGEPMLKNQFLPVRLNQAHITHFDGELSYELSRS